MNFLRSELEQLGSSQFQIDEDLRIDLDDHPRCEEILNAHASGYAFYDEHDRELAVDVTVSGEMIVPCAITLKPLPYDFETKYQEVFSFYEAEHEEDDIIHITGEEIDLKPYLRSAVIADIPMKVIDPELKEYPKGDGWEVITEEQFAKEKEDEIDPRLAKLKELDID